jgi:hypothetical protein
MRIHALSLQLCILTGRATVSLYVDELVQALWLQFAYVVANQSEVRLCQGCGKPFTTGDVRSDKTCCSDSCRQRVCYRRKSTARKMRAEGGKLREIAKAMGTDMKTVKGWLGQ